MRRVADPPGTPVRGFRFGRVAAFKSEPWPASFRNGGRHQIGYAWPECVGIRSATSDETIALPNLRVTLGGLVSWCHPRADVAARRQQLTLRVETWPC